MIRSAPVRAFAVALLLPALLYLGPIFTASARAQQPIGAGTSQVPPPEPAPSKPPASVPKGALAQFTWLAGRWRGDWGPRVAQQVWMPPQSGVMVGVFQLSEDDRTLVVELYTIVSTPRGIMLRVRHFTPTLALWEKSNPSILVLKSIDSKSILFDNAGTGQPKHWLMKRTGADSFTARFEIVPEKGQQQVAEIAYHRESNSGAASR